MTFKVQVLLALTTLLLSASLALAASDAPAAQQAPVAAVAQPFAAPATAAPVCPMAALPTFLPEPQPAAVGVCGACSDSACAGKEEHSVCGSGLRCIPQGTCGASTVPLCNCLII
jgi:hypothetical protein